MLIVHTTIKEAIVDLYNKAKIPVNKIGKSSIVPLRILVGTLGIECIELPNLTEKAAVEFLSSYDSTILDDFTEAGEIPLAGYLYATLNFGCIFVNQSDRVTRRRFSVAHELGHYLLHFRPILNAFKRAGEFLDIHHTDRILGKEGQENESSEDGISSGNTKAHSYIRFDDLLPPDTQMEHEADAFASELLMPIEVLQSRAATLDLLDDVLVRHLSTELLVSQSAMKRRLEEFNLI